MDNDKTISALEFRTLFVLKLRNLIAKENKKIARIKRKKEIAKRKEFISKCELLLKELNLRSIKDKDLLANSKAFEKTKNEEFLRRFMPLFTLIIILIIAGAIAAGVITLRGI